MELFHVLEMLWLQESVMQLMFEDTFLQEPWACD